MKLSIVIVNYRSWGHLGTALDSLEPGFSPDWEVVVVDNESEPEPLAEFAASYPWVRFIANERNSGFGFASNIGVANASGAFLLFMNPDVVASSADVAALLEEWEEHPEAALLAPKQLDGRGRPAKVFEDFPAPSNQSKILKLILRKLASKPEPYDDLRELIYCDWVTGSVLLMRHDDFDRIGGWCEDFWMYAEDADLCRRARNHGLKAAYTPRIEVVHTHGGSSRINVDVKAMTKLEVIISKHVYANNHFRGWRRWSMHLQIALLRLPSLLLAALLDLLTLRRIATLRVRSRMLKDLLTYYRGALRRRTWLSPRALANRTTKEAGAQ